MGPASCTLYPLTILDCGSEDGLPVCTGVGQRHDKLVGRHQVNNVLAVVQTMDLCARAL